MAAKHTKAIFLNNEAYEVRSYLRTVTDDLVSRFGSSEHGQTNLDLLKAETQKSFRGGMFQRRFDDDEKVSSLTGGYYNRMDNNLYPTPLWKTQVGTGNGGQAGFYSSPTAMSRKGVSSWVLYQGSIYFAWRTVGSGTPVNVINKMNPATGAFEAVTIPAAMANSPYPLKLTTFDSFIFAAGTQNSSGMQAHRFSAGVWTDVTGAFYDFITFNEKLYGIAPRGELFSINSHTATPITYTSISYVGGVRAANLTTDFNDGIEYNGACYLGMAHGLYRYDGTAVKSVLNFKTSSDRGNFRLLATFNGRLYYVIKNKLYQFDGINIEELQDFTEGYTISALTGGTDRLWITCTVASNVPYTDKFQSATNSYNVSVFCYDGVGFFEYKPFYPQSPFKDFALSVSAATNRVFIAIPDNYLNASSEERSNGFNMHALNLSDEFSTTNAGQSMTVTSSAIDCGYKAVPKVINGIMTNYGGLTTGESSIKIELQTLNNDTWSPWSEVWNSANVASDGLTNDYLLHDQTDKASPALNTAPLPFLKIRTRTTITLTTVTPTTLPYLSDQTIRYTIQPRLRFQWLLDLQISGLDKRHLTTPTDSAGNRETRTASYLRKIIYDAYRNKTPILFYDVDWSSIRTTSPLVLAGTDFLTAGETIAIQSNTDLKWINRRIGSIAANATDQTSTLTLDPVGYRKAIGGSSETAFWAGAQVRKSHAVYIVGVRNERYLIDDNTINSKNGYTDAASTITLDLKEL